MAGYRICLRSVNIFYKSFYVLPNLGPLGLNFGLLSEYELKFGIFRNFKGCQSLV